MSWTLLLNQITTVSRVKIRMNTKLATSLAEAKSSLSQEDLAVFQTALLQSMISKTLGVAGGYACIRNTRIAIWTLISLFQQGATEAELLLDFPGLTAFDLWIAQTYYRANRAEIDEAIVFHNEETIE